VKSNGVDVISTSLGCITSHREMDGFFANIVQDARNNGITWATAASNDREAHWGGAFTIRMEMLFTNLMVPKTSIISAREWRDVSH